MPRMNKIGTIHTVSTNSLRYASCTYHATNVIYWDKPRRVVILDTGGYNTATTRNRINQACNQWGLPLSVSTRQGQLTIYNHKTGTRQLWDGRAIEVAL